MFEDYFVRVPLRKLLEDHEYYLNNNLSPELYLRGTDLSYLKDTELLALEKILKIFKKHTIHAPFFDLSLGGFDAEIRDLSFRKLKFVLDIAKQFGTGLVVIHFNYDDVYYKQNFKKWKNNTIDFLSRLICEDNGPKIALENIAESTPEIVLSLIEELPAERFIHCFDVGHFNVFSTVSLREWLKSLLPVHQIHFHFHDNHGSFDSHLPIGEGGVDWIGLKTIILEYFTKFSVTLEAHSKNDLKKSVENYKKLFIT